MATRRRPITTPLEPLAPLEPAVPRTSTPYDPATGGIDPVTGSPWIGDDYLNDPVYEPPPPAPTTPPTPTTPVDPTDPNNRSTGQGINERDPGTTPTTNPNLVQYTGTGLYEGPQNDWGMDRSGAPLPGFPQWDTATSLKYRFGREVAQYAPTVENAQRVIQDAIANGWDIRADDRDPTMFWFNNPELGDWEAVRLLSGSNTWEFNWGSNATGGNPSGAHGEGVTPTTSAPPPASTPDTGPFPPPVTPPTYTGLPPRGPEPPPTTGGSATDPAIQQSMRDALLRILEQPEINAESLQNDPAVRAQRIQAQRAEERQRSQLAEQNAFEGYADSGAEQTDLAGVRQQRSESEAAFIGQLAIQQMEARRAEIMRGIEIATQQGQFQAGQTLARELAALDAALRREQVAASLRDNAEGRALQERLANNQLTQQDRQFLLSLGFNYDQLEIGANADATRPFQSNF